MWPHCEVQPPLHCIIFGNFLVYRNTLGECWCDSEARRLPQQWSVREHITVKSLNRQKQVILASARTFFQAVFMSASLSIDKKWLFLIWHRNNFSGVLVMTKSGILSQNNTISLLTKWVLVHDPNQILIILLPTMKCFYFLNTHSNSKTAHNERRAVQLISLTYGHEHTN